MSRIRVGMVGAGLISKLHAKGYQQLEDAKIVAVCDPNEDRAIKAALEWGANRYYTDFDSFLEDPDVDAVDITTPHYLHGSQALAALKVGKHVSVERPLTTQYAQISDLIATAKESKGVFQVFEPILFFKPLIDARDLLDKGEIGNIVGLHVTATVGTSTYGVWDFPNMTTEDLWRFSEKFAGGSPMLYDLVYPAFCIALFLVGPIEKIAAWNSETNIPATDLLIDAPSACMWKHMHQANCFGQFSLHFAPSRRMHTPLHPVETRIEISGTQGIIEVVRSSDPTHLKSAVSVRRDSREVTYGQKDDAYEDSFVRSAASFIASCKGDSDPALGVLEAQQLMVLCLAYNEACKQGRTITLMQNQPT